MKHHTVFSSPSVYAGWPANHGGWQWGDEFLVGFLTGPAAGDSGNGDFHNIAEPMVKRQARSLDGGISWALEDPGVDFEANYISNSMPYFVLGGDTIIRVCGNYDHGGDYCIKEGGFYLSHNRGHTWEGAYAFEGLEHLFNGSNWNTSRTAVLEKFVFLSVANQNSWGSDFVVSTYHDGNRFHHGGTVCADAARCVMPAVARQSDNIIVVCRRRTNLDSWIDAFGSKDGYKWNYLGLVAKTGKYNGNPPALIAKNDKLFCAYADRSSCTMRLSISTDGGYSWESGDILRQGYCKDIGYPRLFIRQDGSLVCVYYWSDNGEPQRIEATVFKAD